MISEAKRAYNKEYYRKNREKILARVKDYYQENKEHCDAVHRAWAEKNKARVREMGIRSYYRNRDKRSANGRRWRVEQYGITLKDYEALMTDQGGVCAICDQPCPVAPNLSIDHHHATNRVRGLLCRNCNSGLGFFRDSSVVLIRAIGYLREADVSA